jgi:hypothetical protein
VSGVHAMGDHDASYDTDADSCGAWPKPSLKDAGYLFSGQTERGNVCFEITANDVETLKLYTGDDPWVKLLRVWFALR